MCCCSVTQSCLTLCSPMDCSPPGTSVHGISQARTPEQVAIPFSRESSQPRDWTHAFCIGRWIPYHWATWGAQLNVYPHTSIPKHMNTTYVYNRHSGYCSGGELAQEQLHWSRFTLQWASQSSLEKALLPLPSDMHAQKFRKPSIRMSSFRTHFSSGSINLFMIFTWLFTF